MPEANSRGYYLGRGARERELAKAARALKIARIHLEMAEQYDRLAEASLLGSPELRLVDKPLDEHTRALWYRSEKPADGA